MTGRRSNFHLPWPTGFTSSASKKGKGTITLPRNSFLPVPKLKSVKKQNRPVNKAGRFFYCSGFTAKPPFSWTAKSRLFVKRKNKLPRASRQFLPGRNNFRFSGSDQQGSSLHFQEHHTP